MILADKIIKLRKKNGWSQEELAEKMNVSRQAVAKWEGAQTIPNLEKLLQLGALFGVTTDYLLKDEIENEEFVDDSEESNVKRVTLAEANEFLQSRKKASVRIAFATVLCIAAFIPLLLLSGFAEYRPELLSEEVGGGIGLSVLFIVVAIASALFIYTGFQNAPYEFLDRDFFENEYGVKGMVQEKQRAYKRTYMKYNIIGTIICVISPIPLLASSFTENDLLMIVMLTVLLFLVGIGVTFFIIAGVRWASMQKLLKEGEFAPKEKKRSKIKEDIGTIYWLATTAIFLGWGFMQNDWKTSGIVWPIAGVLFAGVMIVCNHFIDREQ